MMNIKDRLIRLCSCNGTAYVTPESIVSVTDLMPGVVSVIFDNGEGLMLNNSTVEGVIDNIVLKEAAIAARLNEAKDKPPAVEGGGESAAQAKLEVLLVKVFEALEMLYSGGYPSDSQINARNLLNQAYDECIIKESGK